MKIGVFYAHLLEIAANRQCPVGEVLKWAKGLGIEAVDVRDNMCSRDPESFRQMIADSGLFISSVYGNVDLRTEEDLPRGMALIDLAKQAGAPNVMILPPDMPYDGIRTEVLKQLTPILEKLGEYAENNNIRLSLENFGAICRPYSQIADFQLIFADSSHIYLTLDTGNFALYYESVLRAIDLFGSRIAHVHLKSWGRPETSREKPIMTEGRTFYPHPILDGGIVDIAAVLEKLKAFSYAGTVSIEIYGVSPMEERLSQSVGYIQKFI